MDTDCPGDRPFCDNIGECQAAEECGLELCPPDRPFCSFDDECVECRFSDDCPGDRPFCDEFGNCVAFTPSPEICDNNIDADEDNLVDCNDPDCANDPECQEIPPCDPPANPPQCAQGACPQGQACVGVENTCGCIPVGG